MKQSMIVLLSTVALLSVSNSNAAKTGFTCETIKEKIARESCIVDRTEKEKSVIAEKQKLAENLKSNVSSKCSLNGAGVAACTFSNSGNAKGGSCEYVVITSINRFFYPAFRYMVVTPDISNRIETLKQGLQKDLSAADFNKRDFVRKYSFTLNSKDTAISDEPICSGIVEAGDVRQMTDSPFFMGKSVVDVCTSPMTNRAMSWNEVCGISTISEEKLIELLKK